MPDSNSRLSDVLWPLVGYDGWSVRLSITVHGSTAKIEKIGCGKQIAG
jgi:hypothetical protein